MKKLLWGMIAIVLFTGCASKEEKEARRNNAFDLEGSYAATQKGGSDVDMVINIQNESGRFDIRATLDRDQLVEKEVRFLEAKGIDPDHVLQTFRKKRMVFGEGYNEPFEGGENISDDFGRTSRFSICSNSTQFDQRRFYRYCLAGRVRKQDFIIQGQIKLETTVVSETKDSQGEVTSSQKTVDYLSLDFKAGGDNMYYTQLFGAWQGNFSDSFDIGLPDQIDLTFLRINESVFRVLPQKREVFYKGSAFRFVRQDFPVSRLYEAEIPLVKVEYNNSADDKIILFGQVRSLGALTGTMVHISQGVEDQLGSFKLVKQDRPKVPTNRLSLLR